MNDYRVDYLASLLPDEAVAIQPFLHQSHACTVPYQRFDAVVALVAKDISIAFAGGACAGFQRASR